MSKGYPIRLPGMKEKTHVTDNNREQRRRHIPH
jgi:hypothetical protein